MRTFRIIPLFACLVLIGAQKGATRSVTIDGGKLPSVVVNAGDTVQWTNSDDKDHWIEADNGSFASGRIRAGGTYSARFNAAGAHAYHCKLHPREKGKVTVR